MYMYIDIRSTKVLTDYELGSKQIIENMKSLDVIPMLTPDVVERIEAVVQSKPKQPDQFR